MRAQAFKLSYGWDRLIASDPDLSRLKMGLRAVLGMGLSLAAIVGVGGLLHQPVTLALTGVMTGMMVPINVQDSLPRQQRVTLLGAVPVAVASVCLGTLAAASLWVSALVFLLVIFLAVVAVVLLPSRTAPRVQRAAVDTLHSVASFLEAAAVLPGPVAVERVREIDAKLREVRDAARPLTARKFLADRNALRLVHGLSGLGFFVRQLASACTRPPCEVEEVRSLERQLASNARAVAASLEGDGTGKPWALNGAIQSVRESLPPDVGDAARSSSRVLHWLERIDDALLEVYDSLGGFRARREAV